MRMWMVPPEILCDRHLLGEHVELHMFRGTIRKRISIDGYLRLGLLEAHNIERRHEALVKEMEARSMKHKSPLMLHIPFPLGKVDVEANIKELARRCEACSKKQLIYFENWHKIIGQSTNNERK